MVTSLGYTYILYTYKYILYIYCILSRQVLWLFSWSELSCWPRCSLGLLSTWPISSPSLRRTHSRGLREVSVCLETWFCSVCSTYLHIHTERTQWNEKRTYAHRCSSGGAGGGYVFHKNLSELSSVTKYIIYVYIVYITAEHPVAVALSCFCVSSSVCVCVWLSLEIPPSLWKSKSKSKSLSIYVCIFLSVYVCVCLI